MSNAAPLAVPALLGRLVTLPIRRFGPPGAFLAVDAVSQAGSGGQAAAAPTPEGPAVLLPGAEVPEGAREGDPIDVFIYLDSEDRPIATTRAPMLTLGEVAFLTVTDVTRFGAFFGWGLQKDLLVPYAEQTRDLRRGERHPVGLYIDDTGRLAGTMRVAEMLGDIGEFKLDEWVEGEAWRKDPDIGIFIIVERRFVGVVPASEPTSLKRGEAARFRVASVLADGKIELSLRGHAHEEVDRDAERILERLGRPGAPRVGDRSSPEEIRELFGLSKKAFKRAVGKLLKERVISMDEQGFIRRRG